MSVYAVFKVPGSPVPPAEAEIRPGTLFNCGAGAGLTTDVCAQFFQNRNFASMRSLLADAENGCELCFRMFLSVKVQESNELRVRLRQIWRS